jgi:16S rRNA (uracil1498-N3)-methyltransferase
MPPRFYAPGPRETACETEGAPTDTLITLDEGESHHLIHVLRSEVGDEVELFDGRGGKTRGVVESIRKRAAQIRVTAPWETEPVPTCNIVLAMAVPKGDRLSWMIEKVTELGIDRIIPIVTSRSVVKPSDQKLHKAEATTIAACKQSGRNRLPTIDPLCPLASLPERIDLAQSRLLVGAPRSSQSVSLDPKSDYTVENLIGVIGPEGGLTDEEHQQLHAWGAKEICLSPNILRIETAAVAFTAVAISNRIQQ